MKIKEVTLFHLTCMALVYYINVLFSYNKFTILICLLKINFISLLVVH
jgi:hypothetical protein